LTEAFSESGSLLRRAAAVDSSKAAEEHAAEDASSVIQPAESTTITHRRGKTKFLAAEEDEQEDSGISKIGRAAAKLCRLAFELAKAPDIASLSEMALTGLAEGTQTDAGAVLLTPRHFQGESRGEELEVIASRSTTEHQYHRVSNFLATTVMREGEAVLARNVMGDSSLGNRDSQGEILATSVICAPIRRGRKMHGLIHLYSTNTALVPDPNDLEFTLAVAETMAVALENLQRRQELAENLTQVRTENVQLRERLGVRSEIIGQSDVIRQVTEEIDRAAASNATVLIRGESGVGKELVARAVHYNSPRRDNVFVCLNCAALSTELLASELFGHERGAFTGATERKIGKFEAAHKGTLMLDEIGEMSPSIQAKFLRVLEGHPFERVGGSKPVIVDVRVIAATNRDLEKDVSDGRFRRDLFFRLRVLEIIVPALRKRPEDIPLLADSFLQRFNNETGRKIKGFTPEAKAKLLVYQWPGNVRELKNVIERAVVLCRGQEIDESDLLLTKLSTAGDSDITAPGNGPFVPLSLDDIERRHILDTLKHTNWNKSKTAAMLGIERSTLDRKIRRYGLDVEGEES
jgi:Nif-specific regulatory protein